MANNELIIKCLSEPVQVAILEQLSHEDLANWNKAEYIEDPYRSDFSMSGVNVTDKRTENVTRCIVVVIFGIHSGQRYSQLLHISPAISTNILRHIIFNRRFRKILRDFSRVAQVEAVQTYGGFDGSSKAEAFGARTNTEVYRDMIRLISKCVYDRLGHETCNMYGPYGDGFSLLVLTEAKRCLVLPKS